MALVPEEGSMHDESDEAPGRSVRDRRSAMATYVVMGAALGAALGVVLGSIGFGIAIGVSIGVALGASSKARREDL